jgi:hypothetical protein
VETVLFQATLFRDLLVNGVAGYMGWDRPVERCVEECYRLGAGELRKAGLDNGERRAIVAGGQIIIIITR